MKGRYGLSIGLVAAGVFFYGQCLADICANAGLGPGCVETVDIKGGSVKRAKLGANSVIGAKILDGSVATADLADSAVNSAKVQDNSLVGADILDGSISSADLGSNSVGADEISAGAVGTSEIADNAVTSADVQNGSLTGTDILDGSISSADLGSSSVYADEIATGAVGTSEIADGAVTGLDILDGTITGSDIASNSIPATDMQNEPGISWTDGGSCSAVGTTVRNCLSDTIVAPTSGYVMVQCKAYAVTFGQNTTVQLGVSTASNTIGESTRAGVLDGNDTLRREFPMHTFAVFAVSAGSRTFYCNALKPSVFDAQTVNLGDLYMTSMFFPTSY